MNPQLAQQKGDQVQGGGKVSAQDAEYIDQAGNCGTCSHFMGDGQPCAVVSDPVSAGGWCKLFEAGQPGGMSSNDADDQGPAAPGAPPDGAAL